MDLFPDFRDLLAALDESRVRFVIIGGYAVIFHGRPRATKDMDLLVAIDPENRSRLSEALAAFGAPASVVEAARAMAAEEIVFFGTSPLRVDILGSASGVDFESAYEHAVRTALDGVNVRIMSVDDLIANKRAAGRPRDLEDCRELERIRAKKR